MILDLYPSFGKWKREKFTFKSIDPTELLVLSFLVYDLMYITPGVFIGVHAFLWPVFSATLSGDSHFPIFINTVFNSFPVRNAWAMVFSCAYPMNTLLITDLACISCHTQC